MKLGEKLRQARLEAGLSQRELSQGIVTRNMLSQIESGTANPSMETLRLLAGRLEMPMSTLLEEEAVLSPNQSRMAQARDCFRREDWTGCVQALDGYRGPDPVFDEERGLLELLSHLGLARQALDQGREVQAQACLARGERCRTIYRTPALERELLLSRAETGERGDLAPRLPADDRELLLRAEAALDTGDCRRGVALLAAAENKNSPRWNLLEGRACVDTGDYARGRECLANAVDAFPRQALPLLEECCRALEDYWGAYQCACRLRELTG